LTIYENETALDKFLKYLPNVLINFAAVFLLVLMTKTIFGLDLDYFVSKEFIITTVALVILYMTVHWSYYDFRVKKKRSNSEYIKFVKDKEKKISDITNTKEWVEHCYDFVSEYNQNKKIDTHRIEVRKALKKLKEKASKEDKLIESRTITKTQKELLSEDEIEKLKLEYEKARENNEYCQERERLTEQLTDDWIVKNIDKISIGYDPIDTQFIETGDEIQGVQKDKVVGRGKYLRDNIGSRVFSFALTFIITGISVQQAIEGASAEDWTVFGFRMLLLLFNALMGINYGDRFFEEVDVHNINRRVTLANKFKGWALDKGFYKMKGAKS